ncbi:MAG: SRPBCC domain-containing protein, partial [Candidatus Dormibacteraceae bacterium]
MDVRPGGVWKSTMRGPDGTEYLNDCVFTEVVRPRLIAYRLMAGGKRDGGVQEPMEGTWIFEAQGEKTKITLRMLFRTPEALQRFVREYKAVEGGNETLDRLARHLVKDVRE